MGPYHYCSAVNVVQECYLVDPSCAQDIECLWIMDKRTGRHYGLRRISPLQVEHNIHGPTHAHTETRPF